jgi:uncharacterized protein (UPF0548 family)
MFVIRRPSAALIERVLARENQGLTYREPGMTASVEPPDGYPRNHHVTRLGSGEETFLRAVAAVRSWAMYDLPWTYLHPARPPVVAGTDFATIVSHLGFWSVNPCRIVYVDEVATPGLRSLAFAIGTLPLHSETGEERFSVQWDRATGVVSFEILAYARAWHWMARLSGPFVGILQRRFGRAALAAMQAAVDGPAHRVKPRGPLA